MKLSYITNANKLDEVIEFLVSEQPKALGIDTETTDLCPHQAKLRLIQIAHRGKVYVIDCFAIPNFAKKINYLISKLKKITVFIAHNIAFEIKIFWSNGIELYGCKIFDTMLATCLLDAGLFVNHSLKDVCDRYLDSVIDKQEQKSDWSIQPLTKEQLIYAAKDAALMLNLYNILKPLIIREGLTEVFQLEMRCVFATAGMEYYGAKLDLNALDLIRPLYEERERNAYKGFLSYVPNRYVRYNLFDVLIDEGISLTSNQQVLQVLQSLGVPDPEDDSKPIPSTGKDVIKLLDWNDYPVLEALANHRQVSKLLSSFVYSLPAMINPVTGRLHTSFKQSVSTGRFSSSHPNLQQLPRPNPEDKASIRSCFVPENPEWVLIDCDYSQIELRVMAEVCGDPTMLDEFLTGKDPYANTAALINKLTYDQMLAWKEAKDPRYKLFRQQAKPVRLGYNYSMSAPKFRKYAKQTYGVSMTLEEAFENRATYFNAYPYLQFYHNSFKDKTITEVRTLAPFYRRRQWEAYPGIPALCNHPIQGTSADIQKLAMATIFEQWYEQGYSPLQNQKKRLILSIHDEIVGESTVELAEESKYDIETNMRKAGEVILKKCPVEAEAKIIFNLSQKE